MKFRLLAGASYRRLTDGYSGSGHRVYPDFLLSAKQRGQDRVQPLVQDGVLRGAEP